MSDDIYDTIRRHMNAVWPLKLPKHKKILEFLKLMFPTEEEAKIISIFDQPLLDQKNPQKIAKLTGLDLEKVNETCEKMVEKGVILKSGKKFGLLPIMPGLFEFYFISGKDENLVQAAELFHEIIDLGLLNEWYSSDYPFFRTLPSSSLSQKIKTVEINEDVGAQHEILVFEDVEKYVQLAKSITVVKCACRTTYALLGETCEKPMEICMALNLASNALNDYHLGRPISKEEALELLKVAEDNGLVHTIINGSGPDTPMLICNCCSCHCGVLNGLTKLNNPRAFAKSNFRPEIDRSICKRCETCLKICPMSAIWHHWPHQADLSDNFIIIKEERCIGCGLCAHHCQTEAISMKRVSNDIPEETLLGVLTQVEQQKNH